MKRLFLQHTMLLTLALLLGSCGVYSSYSRPEIGGTIDSLYRDQPIDYTDSLSIADISWRELFHDPALQQLIEKGLDNNIDMKSAHLHVTQAEAALNASKLSFLPYVGLAFDGSLSRFNSQATRTYSLPLVASWELDLFGRLRNAKRRAQAAMEQSREYRQAVQTGLIASIANSYYTLLMLDSQLELSTQTADSWRENVATMQALMDAGMANEAAVSQTRAVYLGIEAALLDLKRQIYEVENSLSILLGDHPGTIQRGSLAQQRFEISEQIGIPVQLLAKRPDVRAAELTLKQAFYATAEARSAFYPSLTLNGSLGWTNNAGAFILNPGKLLIAAAASLAQPLFARGGLKVNLTISRAQQQEALYLFEQTILNAGAEVINALKQIETARAKSDYRSQQIASLQKAVESTQLLMTHGSSTYLEVLTAQQSLLSTQLTDISDRFEEIQGIIQLYRALGGGTD